MTSATFAKRQTPSHHPFVSPRNPFAPDARRTAEFNAAWGPTLPAALDEPPPYTPRAVHGWDLTGPGALHLELEPMVKRIVSRSPSGRLEIDDLRACGFRPAWNGGLAVREVHEPDLFQQFFGETPTLRPR